MTRVFTTSYTVLFTELKRFKFCSALVKFNEGWNDENWSFGVEGKRKKFSSVETKMTWKTKIHFFYSQSFQQNQAQSRSTFWLVHLESTLYPRSSDAIFLNGLITYSCTVYDHWHWQIFRFFKFNSNNLQQAASCWVVFLYFFNASHFPQFVLCTENNFFLHCLIFMPPFSLFLQMFLLLFFTFINQSRI